MKIVPIRSLQVEFATWLSRTPQFVSTIDVLGQALWRTMLECNEILTKLIVNRLLTDKQIVKIINDFNKFIELILDYTPESIHIHLSAYYIVTIEKMIKRSEEVEHYEVCSNLKRFSDYYFTNATPTYND